MKIFLSMDTNCLTFEKITNDQLGGTERFFLLLAKFLKGIGHNVVYWPRLPNDNYDICIHSNTFNQNVKAKRHILWGGSWHVSGHEKVDLVILNSHFMKDKLEWSHALVLPAPYDHTTLSYKKQDYKARWIITTSNPNRHYSHTSVISRRLPSDITWHVSGGNKLYSDNFSEYFCPDENSIKYVGVLSRTAMLGLLSSSQMYVYANLSDNSETECVSALEAAALGLTIILPNRRPFVDMIPDAIFCNNENEFVTSIITELGSATRHSCDVLRFDSEVVFPQYLEVINNLM